MGRQILANNISAALRTSRSTTEENRERLKRHEDRIETNSSYNPPGKYEKVTLGRGDRIELASREMREKRKKVTEYAMEIAKGVMDKMPDNTTSKDATNDSIKEIIVNDDELNSKLDSLKDYSKQFSPSEIKDQKQILVIVANDSKPEDIIWNFVGEKAQDYYIKAVYKKERYTGSNENSKKNIKKNAGYLFLTITMVIINMLEKS